jgi:hypothetical protein
MMFRTNATMMVGFSGRECRLAVRCDRLTAALFGGGIVLAIAIGVVGCDWNRPRAVAWDGRVSQP